MTRQLESDNWLALTLFFIVGVCISYSRVSLYWRKRRARRQHACKDPTEYPHSDQRTGSDLSRVRQQALNDGRLTLLYLKHHRAFGETWQETLVNGIRINTISRANLNYIYKTHVAAFARVAGLNPPQVMLFGKQGILSEGEEWQWSRELVQSTFSKYETKMMPILKTHADRFIEILPRDGGTIDIQPLAKGLFLGLIIEFLFGGPSSMQTLGGQTDVEDFHAALNCNFLESAKHRTKRFTTHRRAMYPNTRYDRMYASSVAKVHTFVNAQVQAALVRASFRISNRLNTSSTEQCIFVEELAKQTRDLRCLRFNTIQCFVLGRDSTAILLSNTLFALARHPEHWARLRSVALSLSEENQLSFQKLSSLHPLRHVILEALRLYGPGGIRKRLATQDVVLPEGGGTDGMSPLFVPRGTFIVTHVPVMHRNKRYWGEDADEYRPQRFEDFNQNREFKPFMAGSRTCPAEDQALVQVTYMLVRLLKEFKAIENRDEVLDFVELAGLITESRRGTRIALIPA